MLIRLSLTAGNSRWVLGGAPQFSGEYQHGSTGNDIDRFWIQLKSNVKWKKYANMQFVEKVWKKLYSPWRDPAVCLWKVINNSIYNKSSKMITNSKENREIIKVLDGISIIDRYISLPQIIEHRSEGPLHWWPSWKTCSVYMSCKSK